jgi:hypothetical protein
MKLLLFTRALASAQPIRLDRAIPSPSVVPARSRRRDDAPRLRCVWSRAADGRLACRWQRDDDGADDDGIPLVALRRFPLSAIARRAASPTYP